MRTLLVWALLGTAVCAADVVTLQKQLDSIENDDAAKAELLSGVKTIMKWAVDGQSSKDARACVDTTATAMVRYWGEDSAALLKKRLNGMISVVNREVRWHGTAERFQDLKAELIKEKKRAISGDKPEQKTTVKRGKSRGNKELRELIERGNELKKTELDGTAAYTALFSAEALPYKWTIKGTLSGMISKDNYCSVSLGLNDSVFIGSLVLHTLPKNVPAEWKKGDEVELTGYITRASIYGYPYKTAVIDRKLNKCVLDTKTNNPVYQMVMKIRGLEMISPELLEVADDQMKKRVYWDARTIAEEK